VARLAAAVHAVTQAEATDPVRTLLEAAMEPFGAVGGMVLLLTEDGELRLHAEVGVPPKVLERFLGLGIASGVPITDAVRFARAVWLETVPDRDARYPVIRDVRGGTVASASLPVIVGDQVVGALGIGLDRERTFTGDERRYLEALTDLCALALERSRSEEATRYEEEKNRWAVSTLAEQFRLVGVQRERAAEEAQRRRIGSIVDAMTEGVAVAAVVRDAGDGRLGFVVEYANPAAAEVLGADRSSVVGRSITDLPADPALFGAARSVFEQEVPSQLIVGVTNGRRVEFTITRYADGVVLLIRTTG
jgi:PAS domain-containing protein